MLVLIDCNLLTISLTVNQPPEKMGVQSMPFTYRVDYTPFKPPYSTKGDKLQKEKFWLIRVAVALACKR